MEKTVFRPAGPLIDYSRESLPNKYNVRKITFEKTVHSYCRLGGDNYTNHIVGSFYTDKEVCDYVYLDKAIEDRFEASDSIIEEVLAGIIEIIENQCPSAHDIRVTSTVCDSVPKNMPITVEAFKK